MAGARKPGPQCSYTDWADIDDGTACRAQSPAPGSLGLRTAGYDFHGVRQAIQGSTYVTVADATSVAMPNVNHLPGTSMSSHSEMSADLLSWFGGKLSALDNALRGNARQSWGMIIWGEGTGEGSTATKASSGASIWNSSFDYKEFMDLMDFILDAIPEGTSYREKLEEMHDALDARDPEKAATFIKKSCDELEKILDAGGKRVASATSPFSPVMAPPASPASPFLPAVNQAPLHVAPSVKKAARFEMGQWVAYDVAGNMYVMIKYSDGSRRYVFGSIFGTHDIPNPGPMKWRHVSRGR